MTKATNIHFKSVSYNDPPSITTFLISFSYIIFNIILSIYNLFNMNYHNIVD